MSNEKLKQLANCIRVISAEAVEKANSGHPGMPLGAADYSAVLWSEFLRFNPKDPSWIGRDRFVLSAGHGSMLLYSLLHLFGYDLSLDEIKNFRQWGSLTPGHPEFGLTPGVDVTTGPLGQGVANGVGMATSIKMLAARYGDSAFNQRVFGVVSDGDLMEGVASEAASLAGHLKLDNLVYIYDDNEITIGGRTDLSFTEDVAKRFEAFNWYVQKVDGHNYDQIRAALNNAVNESERPSIICARTIIGKGSPNKADTSGVHGSPLGDLELSQLKKVLGYPSEEFFISDEVKSYCSEVVTKNIDYAQSFETKNKESFTKFRSSQVKEVTSKLKEELYSKVGELDNMASRKLSGEAIQIIAKHLPNFVGGSADLAPSTNTLIKTSKDVTAEDFSESNFRFGVREHAMGSMINGLAYDKCWYPFSATFLVFSDYMRPAIRLAALSHLQSLFIFTHDSFFVGEDGPTHQPIEHIAALRAIPNLDVWRPADGLEVAGSYVCSLENEHRPSTLLFTRQNLPKLDREDTFSTSLIEKGGYILKSSTNPEITIVATGSEVGISIAAAKGFENVQVVSMPCQEVFLRQNKDYQDEVLPSNTKYIVVEAGIKQGWGELVGRDAVFITKESFGASAPGNVNAEKFGFTKEKILETIEQLNQ